MKGYLTMGIVMLIQTCITLTKTVRDNHESSRLVNRIEDAKAERLLMEFPKPLEKCAVSRSGRGAREPRNSAPRLSRLQPSGNDVLIAPAIRLPHCASIAGAIWLSRFFRGGDELCRNNRYVRRPSA